MRPLSACLWLCLAACATTTASKPTPAPAAEPAPQPVEDAAARKARIEALFAREAEPGQSQPFTVAGHELSAESAGPIEVKRQDDSRSWVLTLGLTGATTKVTCYLFEAAFDVGGVVTRTLAGARANVAFEQVRPTGVEVIEKAPAVFVEGLYSTGTEVKSVGHLELMAYASEAAPLLCVFDEPGFSKSFRRVAGAMAGALGKGLAGSQAPVVYRSISVTRLGQLDVGFSVMAWVKEAAGTTSVRTTASLLIPRSPTDLMTTDTATRTSLQKDATVQRKVFVSASNGELERKLVLDHEKGGTYTYSGTVQGKDLKGQLKTRDGKALPSDLTQAKLTREFLAGKKKDLVVQDYVPDASPAALTDVTLTRAEGPGAVTFTLGPVVVHAQVDEAGLPEASSLEVGPLQLKEARVFVEGSPK